MLFTTRGFRPRIKSIKGSGVYNDFSNCIISSKPKGDESKNPLISEIKTKKKGKIEYLVI